MILGETMAAPTLKNQVYTMAGTLLGYSREDSWQKVIKILDVVGITPDTTVEGNAKGYSLGRAYGAAASIIKLSGKELNEKNMRAVLEAAEITSISNEILKETINEFSKLP